MLGLQGSSSSPKVYRCVACSATFTGLASLLVHQASHASEYDKKQLPAPPKEPPSCTHCGAVFPTKELSAQHRCQPQPETSAAPPLLICECGEEFHDFSLMLEHKTAAHASEAPPPRPQQGAATGQSADEKGGSPADVQPDPPPHQPANSQPPCSPASCSLATPPPSDLSSSLFPQLSSTFPVPEVDTKEGLSVLTTPLPTGPPTHQPTGLDMSEENTATPAEQEASLQASVRDQEETVSPVFQTLKKQNDNLPKNKAIMKMLAKAYMQRLQPVQSPFRQSKRLMVPKSEIIPVEITSAPKLEAAPGTSVGQLRRLLTKSGLKPALPPGSTLPLRAGPNGGGNIISLTKMLCPVVVLETRQKLVDSGSAGTPGRYQCGLCRRVFQNIDGLTVHHSTHRKERIQCCRLCKQLIIGKPPLPDNHVCPHAQPPGTKPPQQSLPSTGIKLSSLKKTLLFHNQKPRPFSKQQQRGFQGANAKKLFFCPVCKHNYSRRYNLTKHKCQGPPLPLHASTSISALHKNTMLGLGLNCQAAHPNPNPQGRERPQMAKSVAVGTETGRLVKREVDAAQAQFPDMVWPGAAKSFSPFLPKTPKPKSEDMELDSDDHWELLDSAIPQMSNAGIKPGEEGGGGGGEEGGGEDISGGGEGEGGEGDGGQWTIPLDDSELDGLIDALDAEDIDDEDDDDDDDMLQGSVSQGHANPTAALQKFSAMPFFIKDGARRYPCDRCHKTYSRGSTLRRHKMLCGGGGGGGGGGMRSFLPQQRFNNGIPRPMFDCFICGKSFNRRDNMLTHSKKCQLMRTVVGGDKTRHLQQQSSSAVGQARPPPALGGQREGGGGGEGLGDNGSNWGIMSLPSVLPRRVTCECGAGFTSPRLLLEHLQRHAQESYTCPTCGETLSSWADYEVHLQIHMQPRHQLYQRLQQQRSQPLLLRFQQHPPEQRPPPPKHMPPPPALKQQQQQQRQQQHQQRLPMQRPQLNQHAPPMQRPHPNPQPMRRPRPRRPQQRSVCIRCQNTFCSRGALLKHLSLNRCKGDRVAGGGAGAEAAEEVKANRCSRCSVDFPSISSLALHQRSGMCKPAFKPMRCPVCVRWFGTVEGLQKHLLSHNTPETFRCLICQRSYPSLRSLKNHHRKVHRIMAGDSGALSSMAGDSGALSIMQ